MHFETLEPNFAPSLNSDDPIGCRNDNLKPGSHRVVVVKTHKNVPIETFIKSNHSDDLLWEELDLAWEATNVITSRQM